MGQSLPKPALRPFLPGDLPRLVDIYQASVMELAEEDYSEAQREAWAAIADDESFGTRLAEGLTLLATMEGLPVGFASLKDNERVDFLYVHPATAGQGVASMLYDAVEKLARARGAKRLTVDASDTARPFFERRGFMPQRRNTVSLGDEWLATTTMEKRLAPQEDGKASS
ncbi:GNAT family N-acetyltransferase [Microvirga thermotolerans]|uniref:GNAT family N-acetyltransferase n=1 Tax=Microvirga thermotolerans TaxID=2651334 RepID=A0A5P9JX63_9HYPH|nr:GNAT family N-acetyltransferase [Microvirga thermotolerans]QFU17023.1 GNAT family N-acetyltransferase [Microvirga thermotolerans]